MLGRRGLPERQRVVHWCTSRQPPSSLIACHVGKSPTVKIMLGGHQLFYPPRMFSSDLFATIRSLCASGHGQIKRVPHILARGHVHRPSSLSIVRSLWGPVQIYGLGQSKDLSMEACSDLLQSTLPFIVRDMASRRLARDSPHFL